jgi:hypothetical protein
MSLLSVKEFLTEAILQREDPQVVEVKFGLSIRPFLHDSFNLSFFLEFS